MSRALRPRSDVDYSSDSKNESVFTVESASKWKKDTSNYMKIRVTDDVLPELNEDMSNDAKNLIIPEWINGEWLKSVNIKTLDYNNKIKTLISKIKKVYLSEEESITEVIIDGFMESLLHILCFDDYPCFLYPQYNYLTKIGPNNHPVKAKPDFSILSEGDKIMLVIEDKTVTSATYANNWKEDQVLGELFAAVHYVVTKSKTALTYPIIVYAVRVIGTKFTFYKANATLEYIKESAKNGVSINNEMVVQRYPPVQDDPSTLTAYNICNLKDRIDILKYMCSIRKYICK
jgi:hypothetical protein